MHACATATATCDVLMLCGMLRLGMMISHAESMFGIVIPIGGIVAYLYVLPHIDLRWNESICYTAT